MSTAKVLFDILIVKFGIRNDAHLARTLEVAPPVISKLRSGRIPFGPTMTLKVHDSFDIPVRDIKMMLEQTSMNSLHRTPTA